ncbi:SSU processome component Utp10 [Cordyceps militaris CM01]|uniref:U3 small nucleolar RNA-associated protein 10 n=1 Tax=Cordyceps militaris (strain CM01) TaxID=983644 RepID=G3J5J4_CORMM|nr:SSU processome component Utp10 [Cordyceps militaris CM01]EGX96850.1 SSU processome component Utp10 [Cordyceps militaris CM01]
MATSLAAQLAQVAANSKSSLSVKAQKAAHSKSLIWEPKIAATQSLQTLYATCFQGFEDLCQLDARFVPFGATIFSEESQDQDRFQLTSSENDELSRQIDAFLRLVGGRLRLMPAVKAVEWLIRRFRIHEENTVSLVLAFLPYHSISAFATLLSILPQPVPHELRFLNPYIRSLTAPPRSILVHQAINHPEFLSLISEYTLESCRKQHHYPALVTFWAGLMTESVNGLLDRAKSGRSAVQAENTQALLHRLGPIFAESLMMKSVPSLQIASYMAMTVFVSKGSLEDAAVTAFMQQTVLGWSSETIRPGLVCLTIMAQFRSAKQMNSKVTKALMKVSDVGALLVEIGKERSVDKLANGLCLALIERLTKKGDARGLTTIMSILSGGILKEKQTVVVFKSLLLTALKLSDDNDQDGSLRRELGSVLIALSQISGKVGDIVQSVIKEVEFDIEELEMKLDLSFRSRRQPEATQADAAPVAPLQAETRDDIERTIDDLNSRSEVLSICLVPQPSEIFNEFSHLFFSIVSEHSKDTALLSRFEEGSKLRRQTAFNDCGFYSFFMRIWSGPYPALARTAALDVVKNNVKASEDAKVDMQHLIPYCVTALSDPSKRVRRSAADLLVVLSNRYTAKASFKSVWGAGTLYGEAKDGEPLASDIVTRLLHLQLLPTIEECVMDPNHIDVVIKTTIEQGTYYVKSDTSLGKKDHMSSSSRLSLLLFFSGHAVGTPILLVKERLLKVLNGVKGASGTSRTKTLLPALKWWATLSNKEIETMCRAEHIERAEADARFVDVVVPNDTTGLEFFIETLTSTEVNEKPDLVQAIFIRIRKMWPLMKDDSKFTVAQQFLELSQESGDEDSTPVVATEASDLLRTVPLTTEILSHFLDSIQTGTKMITEPPPNKRRRTSSTDGNRELIMQVTPELSKALRKVTFVLQLVDNSEPINHPELLDGLFTALSELQHFRTVVGSELGYLQNLILRSLLAMMPAYKANENLDIDSSGGYGDLLVNCIQKSSSPVVQNAALLLIANLATTAPSLVLHSVMPIFTFMGASVLRQNDDYSAHVVSQTIKEVVPPLIASLRKGQKNPLAGASDILVSFTTAYEHVPSHRRPSLFLALVETLGPKDFLFALISMLVSRYDASDDMLQFSAELLDEFSIDIQLETLVKLLGLTADLFKTKPGLSATLFGAGEDGELKDVSKVALRQLTAFPSLLSSKALVSQIAKLEDRDDMEAAEIRSTYATLLENVLLLSDTVKANKALRARCGVTLANLLNLLSIGEFIKAVENLLDRPDLTLRQKVLKALEARVESESNNNPDARIALLTFLPQLTAAIRESQDIRYKHTAVTCVDKIAEKYGKKDIEAVVAAASTIAGEHCLGQSERLLRTMALLCLTSLVDVLQEAIVPVLPLAVPRAIAYLEQSLDADSVDEELHSASYGLLASLAEHLPYMLSTYMDDILRVSNTSATADLEAETNGNRVLCLEVLAKKMDAKEMLMSLDRNWESALSAGPLVSNISQSVAKRGAVTNGMTRQALTEFIKILGTTIESQSKGVVAKNSGVISGIFLKAFDLRRRILLAGEGGEKVLRQISELEAAVYETALKMIYKLNDAAFRPVFQQFVEWPGSKVAKSDSTGRALQQLAVYGFLQTFFDNLKSIVTNYATYVLDDAVKILGQIQPQANDESRDLWRRVLGTLSKCFEHDQDDFWQAPAHFEAIAPVLLQQFLLAPQMDMETDLIPATVELAAAADSQAHQKELNSGLLLHLRSEQTAVRLAAVKCEQALTDRLGEEWMSMLHEMLPRISELQEDDDEVVERETHRWIVKIEGVLGESLDAMLQ